MVPVSSLGSGHTAVIKTHTACSCVADILVGEDGQENKRRDTGWQDAGGGRAHGEKSPRRRRPGTLMAG